jgi:NAD dependent epimerase/dehydratase family enzyme
LPFAPALGLRVLLGEFANVILEGQRVVPRRLLESGYSFRFPTLLEALEDLVRPSAE